MLVADAIVATMQKTLWFRGALWMVAVISAHAACGGSDEVPPPTPAEFGLDTRPSNTTCVAKPRPVIDTGVALQRQWANLGFTAPIFLTQAPGDNTNWYVVSRAGIVSTFTNTTGLREFARVGVNTSGEGGLLSFAFHPNWPNPREAFLSYTRNVVGGDPAPICDSSQTSVFTSVIARYRSSTPTGETLDVSDELLKIGQPYDNHNGGHIAFGPDQMLYFGVGDGGLGDDQCNAGQNLRSPLGKLLRIDIKTATPATYNIPADNPFVANATARKEIWSLGHRNPWRWSFDQSTGDLWLGEVGQVTWEEIDRIVKGGNYGWKPCEGFFLRGSTTERCNVPGLIDPVVAHPRTEARSITGGYVYRGSAMPSLVGTYIYGDFETGNLWALTYDAMNRPTPKQIANVTPRTLVSFAQGNDGEIYTVQISGQISKLVPGGPVAPVTFPQMLSETGCVDSEDPTKPAKGMIPYDVNSPLWSDGAEKHRHFAIPDGTTITINSEQDWELPIGSVAMKTFLVGEKPVETRLFMRHDDGEWAGYTYEWDGDDAVLLAGSKLRPLDGAAAWAYPSRDQCLQCHSRAAGGTIGFETAQMNRDAVYPSTNRISNQLATLDHIGLFAAPLAAAEAPKLAEPAGGESLESRARAYLHANCSHCHRPMGGGRGTMDLRYTQALRATNTCNADNTQGTVGAATKLIVPGMPGASILSLRMHAGDAKRMPPVAVSVEDELGTRLIDDWIASLTACP